jgi:3-oxoadipate enol-lactonase
MEDEIVATTSVVNVDGARVAYRLHGRGPAVVLVNGTAALDAHWGPVIAEFSKHRTVISLDYSGSGDTTDDGSALSLEKLARQVREVARAAGVDRFDLVGHSLGAAIAIQLAANSADLVRSLIVVAGFSRGAEPRLQLQFELWLDLLRTNRDAFLRLLLLSGLTPAFVSRAGTSTIEDMIKGYMPLANWEGITRQVELDLAVDVSRQASSITSPTLVINCAHDQIVTQTPELAASIPGSMCQQISAGHLAYFEGADEFLSLATEFLRRHDA